MQDLIGGIGAKLAESGVVVVIGVGLVFLILAMLIGVIMLLRLTDKLLNSWDDRMVYTRARKGEIKKIKHANKERFEIEKGDIKEAKSNGSQVGDQYTAAMTKMKSDKDEAKAEFLKAKHIIKMKYATVFNIRKERLFAIKKATKRNKQAFMAANSTISNKDDFKKAKMLNNVELNKKLAEVRADFATKLKAAAEGKAVAAHLEFTGAANASHGETNNNALIAAITAAVAMMLECEAQEKKVSFRVRNIREVK